MAIDAQEKLKAVRRELAFRRSLYPKWVKAGRIDQEKADREIAVMEAIAADYEEVIRINSPQGTLL